ncbi:hypothetical protein [Enterococcus crotali]|uniref:hypothetical protein n=1 Tax=Enterococcus crotali TaxID=1453587 RepID=UPI000471E655|nr:hypothetical protein [Enterococcus crotali]
MRLEKMPLIMPNVVRQSMNLSKTDFDKGFEKMHSIEAQENVYNIDIMIFKLSESDKDNTVRNIEFYMPISEIPENFPYETIKVFEIDNTIVLRQADLEDNLEEARRKIADYALEEYNSELCDEMYCVNYDIYNETLIDVYIPMK